MARQVRRSSNAVKPRRLSERPGDLPGPLFVHGGLAPTGLSALLFRPDGVSTHLDLTLEQLQDLLQHGEPLWVRIKGLGSPGLLAQVMSMLRVPDDLQPVLVETPQRTRVDAVGDVLQVVTHRLSMGASGRVISEQVGVVLMPNLVLTVEEVPRRMAFPEFTEWLVKLPDSPDRALLDDIFFFLLDEVLDEVLPLLEDLAEELDQLEEASLRRPTPRLLRQAYDIRSDLRRVRTVVWPLRSQLIVLVRQGKRLLDREAVRGFREVSTHVDVVFETAEVLRHQCDGVTASYMASISNRMNQVMKVLTVISSIFVPLTFIAGVYGMNFDPEVSPWNMPELEWPYGYVLCMVAMGLISLTQVLWFRRQGWFQDWTGMR
ncbi:magnesium transporter [Synechococcus sp. A18-46.1]|nr:magnesium transporter [Synechococcus sp. A18-46.1]